MKSKASMHNHVVGTLLIFTGRQTERRKKKRDSDSERERERRKDKKTEKNGESERVRVLEEPFPARICRQMALGQEPPCVGISGLTNELRTAIEALARYNTRRQSY